MPISDLPILSVLRTRMQWHQERQRLLAENVANADTPNYRARDLVPPDFEHALRSAAISLARTEPATSLGWAVPARRSPRMAIATMKCARAATP
jgi:flagellar basal-body rod protein FlgB